MGSVTGPLVDGLLDRSFATLCSLVPRGSYAMEAILINLSISVRPEAWELQETCNVMDNLLSISEQYSDFVTALKELL